MMRALMKLHDWLIVRAFPRIEVSDKPGGITWVPTGVMLHKNSHGNHTEAISIRVKFYRWALGVVNAAL